MRAVLYHFITYLALHLAAAAANECSNGYIRMTNETVSMTSQAYYIAGGLQVCVNNKWATVCHLNWGKPDATVACRQLGLSYISEWNAYIDFSYTHLNHQINLVTSILWHKTMSWVARDCGLLCLTVYTDVVVGFIFLIFDDIVIA